MPRKAPDKSKTRQQRNAQRRVKYQTDEEFRLKTLEHIQQGRRLRRDAERDRKRDLLQSGTLEANSTGDTAVLPRYGIPFCTAARDKATAQIQQGRFYRSSQVARLLAVSSAVLRKKVAEGEVLSPDFLCVNAHSTEFRTALYSEAQVERLYAAFEGTPGDAYCKTQVEIAGERVLLYGRGALLARLNMSRDVFLRLERQGVVPVTVFTFRTKPQGLRPKANDRHYYSLEQIEAVAKRLAYYYPYLRARDSPDLQEIRQSIFDAITEDWLALGISADTVYREC